MSIFILICRQDWLCAYWALDLNCTIGLFSGQTWILILPLSLQNSHTHSWVAINIPAGRENSFSMKIKWNMNLVLSQSYIPLHYQCVNKFLIKAASTPTFIYLQQDIKADIPVFIWVFYCSIPAGWLVSVFTSFLAVVVRGVKLGIIIWYLDASNHKVVLLIWGMGPQNQSVNHVVFPLWPVEVHNMSMNWIYSQ